MRAVRTVSLMSDALIVVACVYCDTTLSDPWYDKVYGEPYCDELCYDLFVEPVNQ